MTGHGRNNAHNPTPAELTTARLVAEGFSNLEVAGRLDISITTVQARLQAVYLKLGISSRLELPWALSRLDEVTRPVNGTRQARYEEARNRRRAELTELVAADWQARRNNWWTDFLAAGR